MQKDKNGILILLRSDARPSQTNHRPAASHLALRISLHERMHTPPSSTLTRYHVPRKATRQATTPAPLRSSNLLREPFTTTDAGAHRQFPTRFESVRVIPVSSLPGHPRHVLDRVLSDQPRPGRQGISFEPATYRTGGKLIDCCQGKSEASRRIAPWRTETGTNQNVLP